MPVFTDGLRFVFGVRVPAGAPFRAVADSLRIGDFPLFCLAFLCSLFLFFVPLFPVLFGIFHAKLLTDLLTKQPGRISPSGLFLFFLFFVFAGLSYDHWNCVFVSALIVVYCIFCAVYFLFKP